MHIQTKFHGNVQIEQEETWTFPKGLPGFEDEKQFTLLPIEGNELFQVLQSIHTPEVAFIVANPYSLVDDYSFDIDEPTIDLLNIKKQDDIFILAVLSVKQPFEASTINLQAPLIFQLHNRQAKQMILNDNRFNLRQPIAKTASKGGH